jgi:hypothetical protein
MAETSKERCIHATSQYLMLRKQEILQGTAKCLVCEIERLRAENHRARVLILEATPFVDARHTLNADMRNFSLGVPPDETTAVLPADQKLKEFFSKHALGPLARPSCIVCGHVPKDWPPAIQHMELPGIVVCFPCRDAAHVPNAGSAAKPKNSDSWASPNDAR